MLRKDGEKMVAVPECAGSSQHPREPHGICEKDCTKGSKKADVAYSVNLGDTAS